MATVQAAVINRALRLINALAAGDSPTTDESNDALATCNAMLDAWRLERLTVYAYQEESLTLTSGAASKTIGPSGDLVGTRPVDIEAAWIVEGDQSYEVTRMEEDEYAAIPNKSLSTDRPTRFLYRGTHPNATLITWPVANGSKTMKIVTRVPFSTLALADTLTVPPGYEDAIVFNLAIRLAPEYEKTPSDEVIVLARQTKGAIKSHNLRPIVTYSELGLMFGWRGTAYNVYTDQP